MNQIENIGRVSLKNKMARSMWNMVRLFLFRPFGTKLFNPWRLFLLKCFGAKVQWDSGVYCSAQIWAPWNLEMGHDAWLGPNVICYNQAIVRLGNHCTVSQYSYLCTAGHQTNTVNSKDSGLIISPIILEDNSWVGTRAFVGMGVTIGEGAVVGATASVYKDVESWTVVGGNPAQFIKKRIIKDAE